MIETTIVAPATPNGVSAIAAIRVSGPATHKVIEQCLIPCKLQPRRMTLVDACGLDRLLACWFPGPNSYTGEDVLELFPHGNPLLVRALVETLRQVPGVRLAEPGEFTRRALLNGRLDMVQAEAVGQVLRATADSDLRNAQKLLQGKLSGLVQQLSADIMDLSVRLELETDFAEEEADADLCGWENRLRSIREKLDALLNGFRDEQTLGRVPSVVLYGAPNAGKSSLANALLGEDRLLVSAIAGTTRDYVECRLLLEGGEVRLVDTAGLAATAVDELDERSMQRTKGVLQKADASVLVIDGQTLRSETIPPSTLEEIRTAISQDHLVVIAKSDILHDQISKISDWATYDITQCSSPGPILVSSQTGQGLHTLLQQLSCTVFPPLASTEEFWISTARQRDALRLARDGIERALEALPTHAVEIIAFELQTSRNAMRSLTGEIGAKQILDTLFAGFCIGK